MDPGEQGIVFELPERGGMKLSRRRRPFNHPGVCVTHRPGCTPRRGVHGSALDQGRPFGPPHQTVGPSTAGAVPLRRRSTRCSSTTSRPFSQRPPRRTPWGAACPHGSSATSGRSVLYEMLTGDPPYIGSTAQAVLGQIISAKPIPPTAVDPGERGCSPALCTGEAIGRPIRDGGGLRESHGGQGTCLCGKYTGDRSRCVNPDPRSVA